MNNWDSFYKDKFVLDYNGITIEYFYDSYKLVLSEGNVSVSLIEKNFPPVEFDGVLDFFKLNSGEKKELNSLVLQNISIGVGTRNLLGDFWIIQNGFTKKWAVMIGTKSILEGFDTIESAIESAKENGIK